MLCHSAECAHSNTSNGAPKPDGSALSLRPPTHAEHLSPFALLADARNGAAPCDYSVGLFARESPEVVQYKCLDHERDYSNVGSNVELLIDAVAGRHDYLSEGLSTVDYTVVFEELKTIYSAGTDPHDAVEEGKPKKSRNKRKAQGKALGGQQRTHFPCTHIKVDF
eukprot:COSAG02_NODE_4976_length_4763_cov_57.094554_6_plen_166_part_00